MKHKNIEDEGCPLKSSPQHRDFIASVGLKTDCLDFLSFIFISSL